MQPDASATVCATIDLYPLSADKRITLINPPFCFTVYTPAQLRALASALTQIAERAEAVPLRQLSGIGQVRVRVDA